MVAWMDELNHQVCNLCEKAKTFAKDNFRASSQQATGSSTQKVTQHGGCMRKTPELTRTSRLLVLGCGVGG